MAEVVLLQQFGGGRRKWTLFMGTGPANNSKTSGLDWLQTTLHLIGHCHQQTIKSPARDEFPFCFALVLAWPHFNILS